MKNFVVVFAVALVLTWMLAQARKSGPTQLNDGWSFPLVKSVTLFYGLVMLLGVFLAVLGFTGPKADRNMVAIGGGAFVFFAIITWPKAVYSRETGVSQKSWYGGWKNIPWHTIAKVKQRRDGSIVVTDKHSIIVLSTYHAGREFFLQELAQHGKRPDNI